MNYVYGFLYRNTFVKENNSNIKHIKMIIIFKLFLLKVKNLNINCQPSQLQI